MKIIPLYILRHFLSIFAVALVAFIGLYLIIDFFEKVDDLLQKQVPFMSACRYFLYKTPAIVSQGIPMAVLLATLIALGILKRNREIIAMKAAGIHTSVYSQPIVFAALFIAALHFGMSETLARSLNHKAQTIWQQQVLRQKTSLSWSQENVWYRGQNCIYQIRLYDRQTQNLEKVSLFYLDAQFKLVQRLDSRRVRWEGNRWVAEEGLCLKFEGGDTVQEWFKERELDLPESPKDFSSLQTIPEQLNWLRLYHYTQKIRHEGYNAIPYEVELHQRVAFPLTTLILSLVGITISLRQGLRTGIAMGVLVALLVAFLYLTLFYMGCSMATVGILPPLVGVWAANVIFVALACYIWITDNQ